MKQPFICIEACGVAASILYRAGIDRVDLEVIYTSELERGIPPSKVLRWRSGNSISA